MLSSALDLAKEAYLHRAEIASSVAAVAGGLAMVCTGLAHVPGMPAKWAERFARSSLWVSQKFSVNLRPAVATSTNPIAPVESK
jgi:hypothetical protein